MCVCVYYEADTETEHLNPRVGSNPVGRFTVIITFLDPFLQPLALHRVMPSLTAAEATHTHTKTHTHTYHTPHTRTTHTPPQTQTHTHTHTHTHVVAQR